MILKAARSTRHDAPIPLLFSVTCARLQSNLQRDPSQGGSIQSARIESPILKGTLNLYFLVWRQNCLLPISLGVNNKPWKKQLHIHGGGAANSGH